MDILRTITRSVSDSRTHDKVSPLPPPRKPNPLPLIPVLWPLAVSFSQQPQQKSPQPAKPTSPHSLAHPSQQPHSPSNPQPRPQIPHQNPLPADQAALEALLNENTVQLQRLADTVKSVNEWIETDGIILARMLGEVKKGVQKGEGIGGGGGGQLRDKAMALNLQRRDRENNSGGRGSRVPSVRFSVPDGSDADVRRNLSVEKAVDAKERVRELKERIKSMKIWRKEMERSVVWQREEGWRIQERMGMRRDSDKLHIEGGGAVGGRMWKRAR